MDVTRVCVCVCQRGYTILPVFFFVYRVSNAKGWAGNEDFLLAVVSISRVAFWCRKAPKGNPLERDRGAHLHIL